MKKRVSVLTFDLQMRLTLLLDARYSTFELYDLCTFIYLVTVFCRCQSLTSFLSVLSSEVELLLPIGVLFII